MKNQNAKYTPGPWTYESKDLGGEVPCYMVYAPDSLRVAMVTRPGGKGDFENARLIAAAPEMYEALLAIREAFYVENSSKAVREAMKLSDIVKKADGRI